MLIALLLRHVCEDPFPEGHCKEQKPSSAASSNFSAVHRQHVNRFAIVSTIIRPPDHRGHFISDTVCPWCYVGVKRMEQAFEEAKLSPEVRWHPFFLNPPGHAPDGMPIEEYLNRKYGPGMVSRANKALSEAGAGCGIIFKSEGRVICDTLRSHILVDYARRFDKENAMAKKLFNYYFEQAKNINDLEVLVSAAAEIGLDADTVRQYLRSGDGEEAVMKEPKEYAQSFRVTGVPYFVVSRKGMKKKIAFSGARQGDLAGGAGTGSRN